MGYSWMAANSSVDRFGDSGINHTMRIIRRPVFLCVWFLCASVVFIAGCENRQNSTSGSAPKTTAVETMGDSIISTKVKSGLLADPFVKGLDPKVETRNGNVQFSGSVENKAQMDRAIEIARSVGGVKSVENKMDIKK